ncbi:hypothetical protein NUW54_g2486 [Trametes sanguinea]|uniref:Uncharacterized protein n=1 Tax=Trametes sanguinea TaxID=158606 RepID=A0ACC1Q3F2_9APHY|nr:hypothetical protein NUW54_g2486 [Trametes sanguinea]
MVRLRGVPNDIFINKWRSVKEKKGEASGVGGGIGSVQVCMQQHRQGDRVSSGGSAATQAATFDARERHRSLSSDGYSPVFSPFSSGTWSSAPTTPELELYAPVTSTSSFSSFPPANHFEHIDAASALLLFTEGRSTTVDSSVERGDPIARSSPATPSSSYSSSGVEQSQGYVDAWVWITEILDKPEDGLIMRSPQDWYTGL